ncbi:MAG: hypothetical protein U0169_00055 [Polyangiaceae bacterium]
MLDPKLLTLFAFGTLLVLNGLFAGSGIFRSERSSALPDEPAPPVDREATGTHRVDV